MRIVALGVSESPEEESIKTKRSQARAYGNANYEFRYREMRLGPKVNSFLFTCMN